jgi:hypothetical protein
VLVKTFEDKKKDVNRRRTNNAMGKGKKDKMTRNDLQNTTQNICMSNTYTTKNRCFEPLKNRPQVQYTIWYFDPGDNFLVIVY